MEKRLADVIRETYMKQRYSFEDVTHEIETEVKRTYALLAKENFSEWPGFDVQLSSSVPEMTWRSIGSTDTIRQLLVPKGRIDFYIGNIDTWFEEQGFVLYDTPGTAGNKAWRIKFS